MNRYRLLIVTVLALVISVLAFQGTVLAEHPAEPVVLRYRLDETIGAGEVWTDREGLHIRNRLDVGTLFGDLAGPTRVVYNADLVPYDLDEGNGARPVLYNGVAYGTIEIFATGVTQADQTRIEPAWEGNWFYVIEDNRVVDGTMTATRRDYMAFLQIDRAAEGELGIITLKGTIDYEHVPAAQLSGADSAAAFVAVQHPPECFRIEFLDDGYWGVECIDRDNNLAEVYLETASPNWVTWDESSAQIIVELETATTIRWQVCDRTRACVGGYFAQAPTPSLSGE